MSRSTPQRPVWHARGKAALVALAAPVLLVTALVLPPPSGARGAEALAAVEGVSAATAVTPTRLVDTRDGSRPLAASTVNVVVGDEVPTDGSVTAVVLNVVATEAAAPGFVTAFAHGTPRPGTSSLNIAPGQIRSSQVTVPLGADGSVDLFVQSATHLVVDLVGYYRSVTGPVSAGRTMGVGPTRVLDTRSTGERLSAGETLELDLSTDVPADAAAAILSVTGVDPSSAGWLSVRPGGTGFDGTSSLNFDRSGQIVANQVLALLSPDRTITIQAGVASADVVVDLAGYVTDETATTSDQGLFVPAVARLVDTRDAAGSVSGTLAIDAAQDAVVPAAGVAGLAVSLVLTETSGPMWAAVQPVGAPFGATSTVNATAAGETVAAPGVVFDGTDLEVALMRPTELVVDLTGWYAAEGSTSTTSTSTTSTSTTSTSTTSTTAPPPSANGAVLSVVTGSSIDSSTYSNGSFALTNTSTSNEIESVTIDLATTLLPDMVFDPNGLAGDNTAKDLQVNSVGGTGYTGRSYAGAHADGYDELSLGFGDFGPGETVTFSVDVDPTTIRGTSAPGPNESGSVSGMEITGATITVAYSGGGSHSGRLVGVPGSVGASHVRLPVVPSTGPTIELVGLSSGSSTATASQVLRVSGVPGMTVQVLQLEAGLYLEGAGYDVDPMESNSAVAVSWREVTIGAGGETTVPVVLLRSDPDAGYNHFVAAVDDGATTGALSNHVLVLRSA